jgi:hypothetical protein
MTILKRLQNSPQIINTGIDGVIITWTDGRNNYASDIYAQKVKISNATLLSCPNRITLNPSTLPGGSCNTFYSQTFSASGGAGSYSFGLSGDLPIGMSFSSPTISGTPTTTGSFPLTLTATDSNGCIANKSYTLSVKADTATTITSHDPNPSSGGQTVTIYYAVTSLFGTPTGNVTVGDGIVNCTGTVEAGTCSLEFNTVGPRTLTAQYLGDTNFNAGLSAGEQHEVPQSSIRINGTTTSYYATIQSVYNAAEDGDTIQIQAGDFPEPLNFNRDICVTIQGGFDTEYTIPPSGTTMISGPLTISDGTITIDNLIIY